MTPPRPANHIGSPEAEVPIDAALAGALLADQHPDLAGMPISLVGSGWDNVIFRIGHEYCARIPRRKLGAQLICQEQKWLPSIAERVPLPVPAPVRIGCPTDDYPWHWSVVPWFEGRGADEGALASSQAKVLGRFLKHLHSTPSAGFPESPYRGVSLQKKAETMAERFERLSSVGGLDLGPLRTRWDRARSTPVDTTPRVLHGDLHPQNIIARDGLVSAIIDWGDLCAGDVATDLAAAWMLFPEPQHREEFFLAYGRISEYTLVRAEGWALFFGALLLDSGIVDNPRHEVLGRRILETIVTAPPRGIPGFG